MSHNPPGLSYELQTVRFLVYEAIYNPQKTRKKLLRSLLPFLYKKDAKKRIPRHKPTIKPLSKVATKNQTLLRTGGYAKIFSADYSIDNDRWKKCVIKRFAFNNSRNVFLNVYNEITELRTVRKEDAAKEKLLLAGGIEHEFIVKFFTCVEKSGKMLLLMEFCEFGDLVDVIEMCPILPRHRYKSFTSETTAHFSIDLILTIMAPIIDALVAINNKGIVHRDVKPENILLCIDGTPKLCDFGQAERIPEGRSSIPADKLQHGSGFYTTPETLCFEDYKVNSDTWQVGITMLTLLYGWGPFHWRRSNVFWDENEAKMSKKKTTSKRIIVKNMIWEAYSEAGLIDTDLWNLLSLYADSFEGEETKKWFEFRDVIKFCLRREIRLRPPLAMVSQHHLIKDRLNIWKTSKSSPLSKFPELQEVVYSLKKIRKEKYDV